ncbi:polycystic kidney disease protein 1-like 2 [Branchiostoma floridae]|uniref:Polycystic kidney disease protein 1-like 2 n=2 Tax=Branchiostoma floridae TaxID=7739 RepID=A0A9J7KXC8_BRAFL|nr:polycystic kidney disease protein 1-like 2 [Branchiostoma floridae]
MAHAECQSKNREYTSLGCWWDRHDRAIPTLEGTDARLDGSYSTRSNAIEKCYSVALSRGFAVFAVQNGGQCFGSTALDTYNKWGASTDCNDDGEGGLWSNEVYRLAAAWLPLDPSWVVDSSGTPSVFKGVTYDAAKALDGSTGTYWNPQTDENYLYNNWYIVLNLTQPHALHRIAVNNYGDSTHDIAAFTLEKSLSGSPYDWKDVVSVTDVRNGTSERQDFGGFQGTAQHWRFVVTRTHSGWQPWLRELDLYGVASDLPGCEDDPCQHGATCRDVDGGYDCSCAAGYGGLNCEIDLDECASNPCQNGAECTDQVNGYTCVCPPGLDGVHCENGCGGLMKSPNGTFKSPGHPRNYDNNLDCVWTITVDPGERVFLSFFNFHLEVANDCKYDNVKVNDSQGDSVVELGTWCGTNIPALFTSTNNTISVLFHSDRSDVFPGFLAKWSIENADNCGTNPCQNGGSCLDQVDGYRCACTLGFEGMHCEEESDCGGLITTGQSGTIKSPGYPDNYATNLDCVWVINLHPRQRVHLSFVNFVLEDDSDCDYDNLKVQDGDGRGDSAVDLGTWCGSDAPPPLKSTNSTLTITFHSDYSEVFAGFFATWFTEQLPTEPLTSTPQPPTSTPQPPTSTPQPPTSTPQPTTSTPQPTTSTPQPKTSTPQPTTSTPQPTTSTPQPPTSTTANIAYNETSPAVEVTSAILGAVPTPTTEPVFTAPQNHTYPGLTNSTTQVHLNNTSLKVSPMVGTHGDMNSTRLNTPTMPTALNLTTWNMSTVARTPTADFNATRASRSTFRRTPAAFNTTRWNFTTVATATRISSGTTSANIADVDECATGTHTCRRDELCVNTDGSFACASCYPDVTLQGGGDSPWSAPDVKRRKPLTVRSDVTVDCEEEFALSFLWAVYLMDDFALIPISLPARVLTTASELTVPRNTLPYGRIVTGLEVVVMETESGLSVARKTAQWLTVKASPLVAHIAGGSARSVDLGSDVVVDASTSYDPDAVVANSTLLTYSWSCETKSGTSCDEVFGNSTDQQSYVISAALMPPYEPEVTLTVQVGYRERDPGQYSQTLQIFPAGSPTVQIRCLSNCETKLNPSERLVLSSTYSCASCGDDEPVRYNWTLRAAPPDFGRDDLRWGADTTTGRHLADVVVQAGVFKAIGDYTLRVAVSLGPDREGFAEYTFQPNDPPTVGSCSVSPENGTAMVTEFTISCAGFSDADLPLTYTFLYSTGAERLASVSTATGDVFSVLHTGQDSELSGLLLPIGLESRDYEVTIRADVYDGLGATSSVETAVKVFSLPPEESTNVATQLVVGANSTLGKLVRQGDFRSVVQLSNSVTSVLNSVSNATAEDKKAASTEARDAVVSALTSVQAMSVTSVNLVANALGQATSVTAEVSTDSQVAAADSLKNMATFLQSVPAEDLGATKMEESAKFMMTAVINVLEGSVTTAEKVKGEDDSSGQLEKTENATKAIFDTVNVMNELVLTRKRPNESPTVIVQGSFELALQKQSCGDMGEQIVRTSDRGGTWFRIPDASVLFGSSCPETGVGFENYQTTLNPYSYARNSDQIKTTVASLQFRSDAGTLEVNDLQKRIDVVTSRKDGSVQVLTQRGATVPSGQDAMLVHEFNLTDSDSSVLISVTLDPPDVPVRLYLRSHLPPSRDVFNLTTTLPLDENKLYSIPLGNNTEISADPYQWLVPAESLRGNDGKRYFVGVEHVPYNSTESGPHRANLDNSTERVYGDDDFFLNYTIRIFTSKCLFFDTTEQLWKSDGCEIGPLTTETVTHCLCNHLTAFGSDLQFFVAPNSLNILAALEGFKDISSNPGVVITIAVVVGIYLLFVIWARREDRKDATKIGATVLGGADGRSHVYQVLVFTGARADASTSAKVSIILHGEYGTSGPHTLEDSTRVTFKEGGVDTFVVTSHRSLGVLMALHVWHDNLGYDPSWFLDKILITDTQDDSVTTFLCNRWLAVEEDDGRVDRVLVAATDEELTKFSTLFSSKMSKNIRDGHLWFSVVGRPATSPFTRVQRASCCLSLLLCSMIVNIMFFGRGGAFQRPSPVSVLGFAIQIPVNWEQVIIGIQSALIVFPVNLAIVQIFRYCRPRGAKVKPAAPNATGKVNQSSRPDTSSYIKDFTPIRPSTSQLYGVRRQSLFADSGYDENVTDVSTGQERQSYARVGSSREGSRRSLRDAKGDPGSSVFEMSTGRNAKNKRKRLLPWWCVYIGWLLLLCTCSLSAFFTMLYGFEYGREKAEAWIFTFLTSFFFDLIITQPLKIFLLAFFFALLIKKPDHADEEVPPPTPVQEDEEYLGLYHLAASKVSSKARGKVGPPDAGELQTARERRYVEVGLRSALYDACFYFVYVALLLVVANGNRDTSMFHLTRHLHGTFDESFSEVTDAESLWAFLRESVIAETHAHQWYNDDVFSHRGFLQDSTSFVVGNVRLRQLRTKTNDSCGIPRSFAGILDDCDKSYDLWSADDVSHDVGWRALTEDQNGTETPTELQPWQYNFASLSVASPLYGLFSAYYDGGYIADLPGDMDADLATVETLEQLGWIDDNTRAVIIEMIVYNPNANLFSTVELMTEFSTIGKAFPKTQVTTVRLYQYVTDWGYVMIAFQIAFILVTLVFCFRELKNIFNLQKEYFKMFWKVVELTVCLMSLASIGVQLYAFYLVSEFNSVHEGKPVETRFIKYKQIGSWLQTDTYLLAWLVCVASLKLLHLLRFNKHVERGARMASAAAKPLGHFFLVFFSTFSAFCMIAYLILGTSVEGFGTYVSVMETMMATMMGEFDYYVIQDHHWLLGPAVFFFYLLICNNGMVFMFLTIFNEARKEVSFRERHEDKSENRKIAELAERRLRTFVANVSSKVTRKSGDRVKDLSKEDHGMLSRTWGSGKGSQISQIIK